MAELPKKRNEIFIRVINIPDDLFKRIKKNAKAKRVSNGNEVLNFLQTNKYK